MRHGLDCFVRLVRVLLGKSAISDKKVGYGRELVVLGVHFKPGHHGFSCRPSGDKVLSWCALLQAALHQNKLTPGLSSKLAGKLSWGASHLFRRMGRAMLRPIFDQRSRRNGAVDSELRRALEWWQHVLESGVAEHKEWHQRRTPPLHLFCDARGYPPHVAAVLFGGER